MYLNLVKDKNQILNNIMILDTYISSGMEYKEEFALALIKKGTCFIAIRNGNYYKFYPSRFIGYVGNNMDAHLNNEYKDGRETNSAISDILGCNPTFNLKLEKEYKKYCEQLGFIANKKGSFGVERKYWLI